MTQRFLTTVLMTDIVGSTEHASELGDRAWHALLEQHNALTRKALRRHGGRELDTAGDGFFAILDAPAAAVACALEVISAVHDLGIQLRAGIHVGEVEQAGKKVGGITVPIAARIIALAKPDEVLVSSTVRDLVTGSGLTFEDRGATPLRGVQGEWRLFSVTGFTGSPSAASTARAAAAESLDRRTAAVRRASARPIWQRRPRLVSAVVVALAAVVATAGLLAWQPWLTPAIAAIEDNAVGLIETPRNVITASISVGQQPGGAIAHDGLLWVTNTGSDTVAQISLAGHNVMRIIDVGRHPIGIAASEGAIWVANSGQRSVSQISTDTSRVIAEIPVGNGPVAVAGGGGHVWVANSTDSTVARIDPATAVVDMRIPVAARPIAIVASDSGVWVASADGAAVTHLDPETGATLFAPIVLGGLPVGIAFGHGAVWVATTDGTVTRVDPETHRITAAVDTGGNLSSIVADDQAVWVADRRGWLLKLDPVDPASERTQVDISSSPEALVLANGSVWVATRASPQSHRGGTLRLSYVHRVAIDPLDFPDYNVTFLEADGLVGYRRVGGVPGSTLLPNLAVSLPPPTNGELTYTFRLRPDLVYSTGEPVRAADFRRAIERSFQVESESLAGYHGTFLGIVGAQECDEHFGEPCDLSEGIVTDDAARTVTFNLTEPDADLLYKLAQSAAFPVPESVPMDAFVEGVFPGTGPYTVATMAETDVHLVRNPHFKVWDPDVRPDGYPDEILWTSGLSPTDQIGEVNQGNIDWMPIRGDNRIEPEDFASLRGRYGSQLRYAAKSTTAAWFNTAIEPFNSLEARQAVNMAVDRARAADLYGGELAVAITCQNLPPGWLGYEPYCPYTTRPDPGGRWQAPDLDTARRLVDASGTKGQHVVVGPVRERHAELRDYIVQVLDELGYDAEADTRTDDESVFSAIGDGTVQIGVFEFYTGTAAPSEFFIGYTCPAMDGLSNYCDESFDGLFNEARRLQATDIAAAATAWSEVDRKIVDEALTVPLVNEGSDLLSTRVGNYQFNPSLGVLLDQLWVQ